MASRASIKYFQIDKAQSTSLIVIATATIITIFSLFACKSLLSQGAYQRNVVNEKNKAAKQLQDNLNAAEDLVTQFGVFANATPNVLGGDPNGSTALDGNNARITLDALPSKYDFPALATSIEKILADRGVVITNFSGIDDELNNPDKPMPEPKPVNMHFSAVLIQDFERSIRPFDITVLELNGDANQMRIVLEADTYYQPSKSLDVGSKELKQ
jgi:hypothetical protein